MKRRRAASLGVRFAPARDASGARRARRSKSPTGSGSWANARSATACTPSPRAPSSASWTDTRATRARPQATLLLGQMRLALGDAAGALDALRRAQSADPPPGRPFEAQFWEAEALFRLKRYAEARVAFDEVFRNDATAPFAPDALYGFGWAELEQKRPEVAAKAFRDLLATWPDHALAPSATLYLATRARRRRTATRTRRRCCRTS